MVRRATDRRDSARQDRRETERKGTDRRETDHRGIVTVVSKVTEIRTDIETTIKNVRARRTRVFQHP